MKPEPSDVHREEAAQTRMRNAIERLRKLAVIAPARAVLNVNDLFREEMTTGDRVAIWCAHWIGSWYFIIGQTIFLAGWAVLNLVGWARHWDPILSS